MTPPTTAPPAPPPSAPPTAPPPRSGGRTSTPIQFGQLAPLTNPRVVLNCVEGWGKTSCAAFAPEPAILCARGENGYQTLLGAGRVPNIAAVVANTWDQVLGLLYELAAGCPYKTLALDALGGFEVMCHEVVTARDFGGDSGPKGFLNYHKGFDVAAGEWKKLLAALDAIHAQGVTIILLSHAQDKMMNNPLGKDYSTYIGRLHAKTWAATKAWADAVLFGTFETIIDPTVSGKTKGIGGTDRVLYSEHRDAYDAKNRYGMAPKLTLGTDPSQIWATIAAAMTTRKAGAK